jgi:ligand-binding SRPBCC domain-containing protein
MAPGQLFPFFADAANLDVITPPWLHFQIVTPSPIEMKVGALIDYRLRVHGMPFRWRTLISTWQPPYCFVDEQVRGPYRRWHHTHTFEAARGGTLARDVVRYAVPCDFIAHPLFVRKDIGRIFAYRRQVLLQRFGAGA